MRYLREALQNIKLTHQPKENLLAIDGLTQNGTLLRIIINTHTHEIQKFYPLIESTAEERKRLFDQAEKLIGPLRQ